MYLSDSSILELFGRFTTVCTDYSVHTIVHLSTFLSVAVRPCLLNNCVTLLIHAQIFLLERCTAPTAYRKCTILTGRLSIESRMSVRDAAQ